MTPALCCHSLCPRLFSESYTWLRSGRILAGQNSVFYSGPVDADGVFSCALQGLTDTTAPPVCEWARELPATASAPPSPLNPCPPFCRADAPRPPSVSISPSGEIPLGSPVSLTCSSDASPPASYSWFRRSSSKEIGPPVGQEAQLLFSSFQPWDIGEYRCQAANVLGQRMSNNVSVGVASEWQLQFASAEASWKL